MATLGGDAPAVLGNEREQQETPLSPEEAGETRRSSPTKSNQSAGERRTEESEPAANETETAASESERPLRVLVVDDDEDMANTFGTWLDDSYEVITTYSGPEALVELDESVDIVVLDRRMPEMLGDLVLEEIRERGLDCKVTMLTAVPASLDVVKMPIDDYLTKPVTRRDVCTTVEDLAERPAASEDDVRKFLRLSSKYRAVVESDLQIPEAVEYLEERLHEQWGVLETTPEEFEFDLPEEVRGLLF